MDTRKELLLLSAARLYSLGVEVEARRERLRRLVEQGVLELLHVHVFVLTFSYCAGFQYRYRGF